jgi:hypothetical protein
MLKSKSALTFKEFMNKFNEVRNFGNNYGQFVIIDNSEKTVKFVPLVLEEKKLPSIIEETEVEVEEESPFCLVEKEKEKEKEKELGIIVLKDPNSWSLFMSVEIDLEKNTAYKRKRSVSSQDLIKAEEEDDKTLKRNKCEEDKYIFALFTALLLWSFVIIFA